MLNSPNLASKEDLLTWFQKIEKSALAYGTIGNGRLKLGSTMPHYDQNQTESEGFLRLLWAAGPREQLQPQKSRFKFYAQGILNGVNPKSVHYWGDIHDYDQFMVELAALDMTLLETKSIFWDTLDHDDRQNIVGWLSQINEHRVHKNNWRFFRILTNVTLKKLKHPYSQDCLDKDIALINHCYVKDGWYFDGQPSQQDYYIAWAFHYYGLLYAHYMSKDDPIQSQLFISRATTFAHSFKNFFDPQTGAAIPFGRSLTYKFAQVAFWCMLVYMDIEVLPWGQIKHLIFQNLRYWQKHSIFRTDGVFSQGYTYENPFMTEGYNGPGSPYWALKIFILLAVPEDHPFWSASEEAVPLSSKVYIEASNLIITSDRQTNMQLFPVGQYTNQLHAAAKYSKFVYSSRFGFSVPRGVIGLKQGAFDNVLAVSPHNFNHYQPKEIDLDHDINEYYLRYHWSPYPQVDIQSFIVPLSSWHVRIHLITTGLAIDYADGGFSIPQTDSHANHQSQSFLHSVRVTQKGLFSGAYTKTAGIPVVVTPDPDTNLLFQHTDIPTIIGTLSAGHHLLIDYFVGGVDIPTESEPKIKIDVNQIIIQQSSTHIRIPTI